jgi:hypothetical protein
MIREISHIRQKEEVSRVLTATVRRNTIGNMVQRGKRLLTWMIKAQHEGTILKQSDMYTCDLSKQHSQSFSQLQFVAQTIKALVICHANTQIRTPVFILMYG